MLDRDTMTPPGSSPSSPRRSRLLPGLVVCLVLILAGGGLYLASRPEPRPSPAPTPSGRVAPPTRVTAELPRFALGFYSAGLRPSKCYGSCQPGSPGAANEARDKQRMAELQAMHVNFVVNNTSVKDWYATSPKSFLAFLNDLHRHGIQASFGITGDRRVFLRDEGGFTTEQAEADYRATDLDGDGVSDLDGRIDALYLSHEVLEWANHAQRVQMYQLTKKWFPHTPVSVYYAGLIGRPVNPAFKDRPHRRGGTWADFAYGPGEADIVHLSAPRPFVGTSYDPGRSAKALEEDVEVVHRVTPDVPIWVSTSFAGDRRMRSDPSSMWTSEQIEGWFEAVRSVEGVRGALLRSYHRFTNDLGNPRFTAQREAWARLGAAVAGPTP